MKTTVKNSTEKKGNRDFIILSETANHLQMLQITETTEFVSKMSAKFQSTQFSANNDHTN